MNEIPLNENIEKKYMYYKCAVCGKMVTINNRSNHNRFKYHLRAEGINIKNKKTGPKKYIPE